eukprot:2717702-Heterocapsa_arctica.AAC.1
MSVGNSWIGWIASRFPEHSLRAQVPAPGSDRCERGRCWSSLSQDSAFRRPRGREPRPPYV